MLTFINSNDIPSTLGELSLTVDATRIFKDSPWDELGVWFHAWVRSLKVQGHQQWAMFICVWLCLFILAQMCYRIPLPKFSFMWNCCRPLVVFLMQQILLYISHLLCFLCVAFLFYLGEKVLLQVTLLIYYSVGHDAWLSCVFFYDYVSFCGVSWSSDGLEFSLDQLLFDLANQEFFSVIVISIAIGYRGLLHTNVLLGIR